MTSQVVGVTSPPRMTPYITPDMFKLHRRRGVRVDNLVPGGRPDAQDAALAAAIESASVAMDDLAFQILAATSDTVIERVNVNRYGYAVIHPRYHPVIAVTAVQIGASSSTMAALTDLTGVGVEPRRLTVPVAPLALTSSQGPIQFGTTSAPMDQAWAQYTYVNGFPVTTLTAAAAAGATTISVADTTGIVAGQTWLTIHDGWRRFQFQPTTVSTAASGGVGSGPGTLGCPALPYALPNSGNYPTQVSALTAGLIEIAVLATRAVIKEGSAGAVAAATRQPTRTVKDPLGVGDDWATVEKLLIPYRALRS